MDLELAQDHAAMNSCHVSDDLVPDPVAPLTRLADLDPFGDEPRRDSFDGPKAKRAVIFNSGI